MRQRASQDAIDGRDTNARRLVDGLAGVPDDFELPAGLSRHALDPAVGVHPGYIPPVRAGQIDEGWYGWADGARTANGALTGDVDRFRVGFAGPLRAWVTALTKTLGVGESTSPGGESTSPGSATPLTPTLTYRHVRGLWFIEVDIGAWPVVRDALAASGRPVLAQVVSTLAPLWVAVGRAVLAQRDAAEAHHQQVLVEGSAALGLTVDQFRRARFMTRQLQRLARTEDRTTTAWYDRNLPVVAGLLQQGIEPGQDDGRVNDADGHEVASWRWVEDVRDGNHRLHLRVGPAAGDVGDWRRTLPGMEEAPNGFASFEAKQLPTVSRHFELRSPPIALALRIAFLLDSAREDRPDLVELSNAVSIDEIESPETRAYVRMVSRAIPLPDGLQFREYQQIGVAFAAATGFRCLIGDAPGVGKTAQAIGCLSYGADRMLPAVVVCPASVVHNWLREIQTFAPWLEPAVVDDTKAELPRVTDRRVYILSMDSVSALAQDLLFVGVRSLIVDESHMIKRPEAKRSQAVARLAAGVGHVLELSGTAMENKVAELWHQLHILDPKEFPSTEDFGYRYRDLRRLVVAVRGRKNAVHMRAFTDTNGADPNAELAWRLRRHMIRRLKSQVLEDLPAKVRTSSWCVLPPSVLSAYRTAEEQTATYLALQVRGRILANARAAYRAAVDQGAPAARAAVDAAMRANADLRAGGVVGDVVESEGTVGAVPSTGPGSGVPGLPSSTPAPSPKPKAPNSLQRFGVLRQLVGKAKVSAAAQWIADRWQVRDDPLIVFIEHQDVLKGVCMALQKLGLRWTYIDGSVASKERMKRVNAFQAGDYDVIVGSRAMHIGLTLHRAAEVLFVERWWVPAQEEQGEDRAHRFGQTRTVEVTYLMARGTVDESIDKLVRRKRVLSDKVLGGEVIAEGEVDAAQEVTGLAAQLAQGLVQRLVAAGSDATRPITPAEVVG